MKLLMDLDRFHFIFHFLFHLILHYSNIYPNMTLIYTQYDPNIYPNMTLIYTQYMETEALRPKHISAEVAGSAKQLMPSPEGWKRLKKRP